MTIVSETFGLTPAAGPLLNESSPELITDDKVGVEVELEGFVSSTSSLQSLVDRRWNVIEDGSLRNRGKEFVYAQPMFGEDVVQSISNLGETFSRIGEQPIASDRCSVHVHLDVRDLEYSQLLSLTLVYLLCEPYFFAVGGADRVDNIYTVPLALSKTYLTSLGQAMKRVREGAGLGGPAHLFRSHINNRVKYSAFNVAPIITQGSIEFRHHRGEWRRNPLINWVNMVLAMKRYTVNLGDQAMTPEFIDSIVNGGYEDFIDEVFEGVTIPQFVDGWDNAARVSKRVSSIATSGIDDSPLLPLPTNSKQKSRFIQTQHKVGLSSIKGWKVFTSRMKDRYREVEEMEEVGSVQWGSTPLPDGLQALIDDVQVVQSAPPVRPPSSSGFASTQRVMYGGGASSTESLLSRVRQSNADRDRERNVFFTTTGGS